MGLSSKVRFSHMYYVCVYIYSPTLVRINKKLRRTAMVLSYSSDCSLLYNIDPSWRSMAKRVSEKIDTIFTPCFL